MVVSEHLPQAVKRFSRNPEAASHPKFENALRSYFRKAERREFNMGDATGKGFARLAK
jgi:hypothetical protein